MPSSLRDPGQRRRLPPVAARYLGVALIIRNITEVAVGNREIALPRRVARIAGGQLLPNR